MVRRAAHNKYATTIDGELDLHGYTSGEARDAVQEFIAHARAARWQRVRIVVGKGTRSADGIPVLPDVVKALLKEMGYTYTYAKLQHGGEGALEISL